MFYWAVLCAASPTAAPALAATVHLGGGEPLGVSLGRVVGALVVCTVVAVLAALLIRQRSGRMDLPALFARIAPPARSIEVLETRRLSPNADVCVVRHGGREYLLLLLAGAAQVLSEETVSPPQTGTDEPCD